MGRIDNLQTRHRKRNHEHWAICACLLATEIKNSIMLEYGVEKAAELIQKEFTNAKKFKSK